MSQRLQHLAEGWRRLLRQKLQAGILQLTLGIAVVIALLCAAMILLTYYSRLSFLQQNIDLTLRDNTLSGIQYVMAHRQSLPFNEPGQRDLFGEGTDTVTVMRKPWGIFEIAVALAQRGRHRASRTAILGAVPDSVGMSAFYTPDNNAPVYLAGHAKLVGTVYASERKFSSGYVDGKGYSRPRFVDGTVRKSAPAMPLPDTTFLHENRKLQHQRPGAYRLKISDRLPAGVAVPFDTPETPYYYSQQVIDLDDSVQGQVIIHSAFRIRVTAHAVLNGVILIAPDIDIDNGFHGTVQCFAERTITVGAESELRYPSALVLLGGERDSTIVVKRDARVSGVVIIPGYDQTIGSRGVFRVEEKAFFHGMAYINGATDIQGTVWGHIMTRTTQARVKESVYGNTILDGEINGRNRSEHMPATLLWGNTNQLVITQWLR
jgi:hypothetical protein